MRISDWSSDVCSSDLTWRMTQGIYRYDATLRDAVLQTPLDGELPTAHLYRLPEWCVYVETDQETTHWAGRPLHGFFAHLEYDIARGGTPEQIGRAHV